MKHPFTDEDIKAACHALDVSPRSLLESKIWLCETVIEALWDSAVKRGAVSSFEDDDTIAELRRAIATLHEGIRAVRDYTYMMLHPENKNG